VLPPPPVNTALTTPPGGVPQQPPSYLAVDVAYAVVLPANGKTVPSGATARMMKKEPPRTAATPAAGDDAGSRKRAEQTNSSEDPLIHGMALRCVNDPNPSPQCLSAVQ
jgi:hypothetical protein